MGATVKGESTSWSPFSGSIAVALVTCIDQHIAFAIHNHFRESIEGHGHISQVCGLQHNCILQ